jgi:hypothetical protein
MINIVVILGMNSCLNSFHFFNFFTYTYLKPDNRCVRKGPSNLI